MRAVRASTAAAPDVSRVTDGQAASENGRASEHTLRDRRDALLGEMRDALETTRSRRTTMTAALENVRIQLLRIGAGIGSPDDMRQEIATLAGARRRAGRRRDGLVRMIE